MTLWEAYQLANKRRAAVSVDLAPGEGFGNGRTERMLRVSPNRVNGCVAVQQGATADWILVAPEQARATEVTR